MIEQQLSQELQSMNTEYYIKYSLVEPESPPYLSLARPAGRPDSPRSGGASPSRKQEKDLMSEFIQSAMRETGDTGTVTFLTAAIIALAGVLMAATSFALI
jgi:hypothetical protein